MVIVDIYLEVGNFVGVLKLKVDSIHRDSIGVKLGLLWLSGGFVLKDGLVPVNRVHFGRSVVQNEGQIY